jgi:hypothetical protein
MAAKPSLLEANWRKVQAVMTEPGRLDRMTKEIIAVAVSRVGNSIQASEDSASEFGRYVNPDHTAG